MNQIRNLSSLFTYPLRLVVLNMSTDINFLQEIRMRTDKPLNVIYKGKEYFARIDGELSESLDKDCMISDSSMIMESIQILSSHSMYAYEDEIRQGFLTVAGGHRVGICGKVVLDGHLVKTIKDISSINIRFAHEVRGCADKLLEDIYEDKEVCSLLIVSPPAGGKTTLLRDIIRQVSDGNEYGKGVTVGLVDERSEIAACYKGVPQNDVGMRTDVLDCCPKTEGMQMLLRSMSPKVIAVDEIGDERDYDALNMALYCGCKILATVHGSNYDELLKKPLLNKLINQGVFNRIIFLKERSIEKILNAKGCEIVNDG